MKVTCPGPNGFPVQYYKTFSELLVSDFLKAFNSLSTRSCTLASLLELYISVIPKVGKEPTNVANYRPISLLNVDVKLFLKILGNQLPYHVLSWVGLDQMGFVPGRDARDNTIKALNLHHWLTSDQCERFFLSMDAEKAWDFMEAVLGALGLGTPMRAFVLSLYANPRARVRVNGYLSSTFFIHYRIRQVCPLSPLLYILTLEHLLPCIWAHPDIRGIEVRNRINRIAAFCG